MNLEHKVKDTKPHIATCSVCQDYAKLDEHGKRIWYTPTTDERRFAYRDGYKLSHGLCLPCTIITLEKDGVTPDEIKSTVDRYK